VTTRRTLRRPPRTGFTLFEILVVLVLMLLLAAIILPSVGAFRGDSRQRAAVDQVRGELAAARGRAMEEGRPYRIAVNDTGTRLRRAPDGPDFASTGAFGYPDPFAISVEYEFEHVTASVLTEQQQTQPAEQDGWITVAVVQPDGTCRDDSALVLIKEEGNGTMRLRVRGLTGSSRVISPAEANGGAK
jgi:type II secretion system protein H